MCHVCLCTFRDTVIVTLANFFTGIFAGFVVFGFLGFMAGAMEMSIEEVIESGTISCPLVTTGRCDSAATIQLT
jgi:hypothetical protein